MVNIFNQQNKINFLFPALDTVLDSEIGCIAFSEELKLSWMRDIQLTRQAGHVHRRDQEVG